MREKNTALSRVLRLWQFSHALHALAYFALFTILEAISSPEPSDPQSCVIEKSSDVEYDP